MRETTASRMQVVKKEEKEARLKELIASDLAKRTQGNAGAADRIYLLVARSAESPVVRAMTSLFGEIHTAGIEIMAVLCRPEAGDALAGLTPGDNHLRLLSDTRFLEAHELLVLNHSTVWIGDCMRRDPARRDAYECHADDAAEIATWARASFLSLWRKAEAAPLNMPVSGAVCQTEGVLAAAATESAQPPLASTRH